MLPSTRTRTNPFFRACSNLVRVLALPAPHQRREDLELRVPAGRS